MSTLRLPAAILLAAFLLAAAAVPGSRAAGETFEQEKCSVCHIRQSVFFDPSLLAGGGDFREERVCYSCHDGTVKDDRDLLWKGAQHPPPVEGERRCSRCHSPHTKGGGWSVLSGTGVPLRPGGSGLCTGCHPAYAEKLAGNHRGGFAPKGCLECHRTHGAVGKALLSEGRETLCFRCHGMGGKGGHPLLADGAGGKGLPECVGCHPVHPKSVSDNLAVRSCAGCHAAEAGGARKGGKGGPGLHPDVANCLSCHTFHLGSAEGGRSFRGAAIRPSILCARCHEKYRAEDSPSVLAKGTHLTRTAGKDTETPRDLCFRCHSIHKGSSGGSLLTSTKLYSCLECHQEQNTISETSGIALSHPVFERVAKGRFAAAAKSKGILIGKAGEMVCRTCHVVHGAAPGTKLVSRGMEGEELCLWCHPALRGKGHKGKGGVLGAGCLACHPVHGRRGSGPDPWTETCGACHPRDSKHPGGGENRKLPRPANLPVFDARGRVERYGTISCPTCHDPHGSESVERRLRAGYYGGGAICRACHVVQVTVTGGAHDPAGFSGKGGCDPCHVPHGGSAPWMVGVPVGEGGERSEEVCRYCHRPGGDGPPVDNSAGHPRNMAVSRPLPEGYPLFGFLSTRERTGLFTCATCHDVHGSRVIASGPGSGKFLREGAGEGVGAGGDGRCLPCHGGKKSHKDLACTECHAPHGGVAAKDGCVACHDTPVRGGAALHAAKGQGCTSCHSVHGEGKTGSAPASARCGGCHSKAERIAGTVHAELPGGPCCTCHPAHEDLPAVDARVVPGEEPIPWNGPCLRCHRPGGDGKLPALHDHPPSRRKVPTNYGATVVLETPISMVVRTKEGGKPLFPLFGEDGKAAMSGRIGCLTCHDPHAGSIIKRGGDGKGAVTYLRDPSGSFLYEVCSPCHKKEAGERISGFHSIPRKED